MLLSLLAATPLVLGPSAQMDPVRIGGNPVASEWWTSSEPYRWDRAIGLHRSYVEQGNDCWFNTVPSNPPQGKDASIEVLRGILGGASGGTPTEVVVALMEIRELRAKELRGVLGQDGVLAAVLPTVTQPIGGIDLPYLCRTVDSANALDVQLAALRGLGRALEFAGGGKHVPSSLERLLDWIRADDFEPALRATALRIAGLNLNQYEMPMGDWAAELSDAAFDVLTSSMGESAELDRAAVGVLFALVENVAPKRSPKLELSRLHRLLRARLTKAVSLDAYGESLHELSRFYGLVQRFDRPPLRDDHEAFFGRLIAELNCTPVEESAWLALSVAQLAADYSPGGSLTKDAVSSLLRAFHSAEEAGVLERYLPALCLIGIDLEETLLRWTLQAKDASERGRRLCAMTLTTGFINEGVLERVARGYGEDREFLLSAAPALALGTDHRSERHRLSIATDRGLRERWPDDDLAALADALGLESTDEAAASLLKIIRARPRESLPARRAALAIGRTFESGRHGWKGHPFRPELYR